MSKMMDTTEEEVEQNQEEELGLVEPAEFAEEPITGTMEQTVEAVQETTGWNILSFISITSLREIVSNPSTTFFSSLRSVSEFMGPSQFAKPNSKTQIVSRLHRNLPYFFGNYIVLFAVFLVFTIITQPLLFSRFALFHMAGSGPRDKKPS